MGAAAWHDPSMARARWRWLVAVAGTAMIGTGCGSGAHRVRTSSHSSPAPTLGTAGPVGVIRAWSTALRRGDVNAAARYFALPSEFVNGPGDSLSIHTEAQARAANATLPCGAVLLSTTRRGRFVSALFRLTNRPGPNAGCGSGTGALARTDFIIADGHILDWIRSDATGGGAAPGPSGPPPTSGGGPVV